MSYKQQENIDSRIIRIFNTFGPRMTANDGRVVKSFFFFFAFFPKISVFNLFFFE